MSHVKDGVALSVKSLTASVICFCTNAGRLDRLGIFAVRAAAAAVGTGSRTMPERVTSYQSKIDEKDTVADDFLTVAVMRKVALPPAARVLSRQVVTPGVVV